MTARTSNKRTLQPPYDRCPGCVLEADGSSEQRGHNCGRLDRLGGDELADRSPDDTSLVVAGVRVCRVCASTALAPVGLRNTSEGVCIDPRCWVHLRDTRFRHHRPAPPRVFIAPTRDEIEADERGLYEYELAEGM